MVVEGVSRCVCPSGSQFDGMSCASELFIHAVCNNVQYSGTCIEHHAPPPHEDHLYLSDHYHSEPFNIHITHLHAPNSNKAVIVWLF